MKLRQPVRDLLVFLSFIVLTLVMTWPWVLNLRDGAADTGDSYLISWILWWDYHQTFTDPLNLFQANILYPYSYSFAFSEHSYGIALAVFPLFALGFKALTVNGIATLLGFAFSGYGAFRLTRTMTGSTGAAWVAGVIFAFIPYRFHHLPHAAYVFGGWIPLVLEALILYARRPTWTRAAWLGIAFFFNGLTCIHWMILTAIPLLLTFFFLTFHWRLWSNRQYWLRAIISVGVGALALLPFMIPYLRVARLYGLVRGPEEATMFSASVMSWLTVDWQNKFWDKLGHLEGGYLTELALFPGLVPPLLILSAFLYSRRENIPAWRSIVTIVLDLGSITLAVMALLVAGYGKIQIGDLLRIRRPWVLLSVAAFLMLVRLMVLRPAVFRYLKLDRWRAGVDAGSTEVIGVGLIWLIVGFFGSFGMNLFFHRLLFEYVTIFRSIRVPARWAMICFVGLALLAGLAAKSIIGHLGIRQKRLAAVCFALIVAVLLIEQREAPLVVVKGAVDPDAATLWLKKTTMRGGIVELPSGVGHANYLYTLRAADHEKPLVNAVSGFRPPLVKSIEEKTQGSMVDDTVLNVFEAIPVSYVVVHSALLEGLNRQAMEDFLKRSQDSGRLRLVQELGPDRIFVVTKTEQ
jgi:hypothetical protein